MKFIDPQNVVMTYDLSYKKYKLTEPKMLECDSRLLTLYFTVLRTSKFIESGGDLHTYRLMKKLYFNLLCQYKCQITPVFRPHTITFGAFT